MVVDVAWFGRLEDEDCNIFESVVVKAGLAHWRRTILVSYRLAYRYAGLVVRVLEHHNLCQLYA